MDLRAPLPPEHASIIDGSSTATIFSPDYEATIKRLLCQMFMSSQVMELGSESRFTGLILFHRYVRHFYRILEKETQSTQQGGNMYQEMKQIRQHLGQVAAACLFLGCKMSEEPRRIRDVINLSSVLEFCGSDHQINCINKMHETNLIQIKEAAEPPALDDKYWATKEEIVSTEQLVLRMLQFDAIVCHPHRCVLIVMETLRFGTGMNKSKNDSDYTTRNFLLTQEQSDRVILDSLKILNEASLDASGRALVYPVIVLACSTIAIVTDYDIIVKDGYKPIKLPEFWWRALDVKTSDIHAAVRTLQEIINS